MKMLSSSKLIRYVHHRAYKQDLVADDGIHYVIHQQTRFDTKGFKEYHRRMQIFVLLYIEGGSYIDEEDDRWEFVTL